MNGERKDVRLRKGLKRSNETRRAYERRDKRLDNNRIIPALPSDHRAKATCSDDFFRPVKKQTTVRIDADVLAWLRSKGEGHLTRINEILRERMLREMGAAGKRGIQSF